MRIGIPRALLYHRYFPAWERFFSQLGAEVVVSPNTNKRILNLGLESAEGEICLPVKVFYGHVLDLKDKCDYIFVPRMVSVEKASYTCPKFLGMPDMIAIVEDLPPLIAPTINLRLGRKQFYETIYEVGETFTSDRGEIWKAYRAAMKALKQHERKLHKENLKPRRVDLADPGAQYRGNLRIGIAGHSYNVYDSYISLNLMERLRERGVDIVTPENIPQRLIKRAAKGAPKDLFWSYERDVLGSAYHWVKHKVVDGIIYIMAFPCGPDSTIQVMVEGYAKREGSVPLMTLVLDEHSAEAGLVTRIEAFVDLLTERHLAAAGL